MLEGLQKIGGDHLTARDAKRIIEAVDETGDGLASYMEFRRLLQYIGEDGPPMDDPDHWAYYLCEDLRRKVE